MSREQRLSENEALFRAVNRRIEETSPAKAGEQLFEIFCECADLDCLERIEISRSSYEQARAEPDLFIVRPATSNRGSRSRSSRHPPTC
jgi:hypothetical protein